MTNRKPSFARWFFITWALCPALFGFLGWALYAGVDRFTKFDVPATETYTATWIGVLAGLVAGPVIGVFVWLLAYGLSGWLSLLSGRGRAPSGADETPAAPEGAAPTVTIDPWHGSNPYGCCQFNTDDDGYPAHGGPGCRHPEARAGSDRPRFH